jgi:hypothetical protein
MTNEVYWKPDPVHIKKIATILKDILVLVWITFVPRDGVYIYEVDPSNTATIVYKNHDNLSFEGETPLVFCLFTSQLHKALKRAKKTSELVISTTNMDHVLKIQCDAFRFDINSLPDIRPYYDLPVLRNDIEFKREVKDLYETIHAISGISTKLHLGIINDTITWKTVRDLGGLILSIQEVEPDLVANFQGKFLLKYLYKVLKTNISKDVVVQIDTTKRVISFQFDQHLTLIMALALE